MEVIESPPDSNQESNQQPITESTQDPPTPYLPPRDLIVYDLPPTETAASRVEKQVEAARLKFSQRAARFSGETRPVTEATILGARRASARTGFVSGFDPGDVSLADARRRRAERFGVTDAAPKDMDVLRKRQLRFGGVHAEEDAEAAGCLERRRVVAPGEVARKGVVHVFGADQLATRNVLGYFGAFGPSWCEWVNDSSCNVVFEDAFSAVRAVRDVCVGEMGEEFEWRRARGVKKKGGVVVPIWVRMATEGDRRPGKPNPQSRWSRTVGEQKERETEGEVKKRSAGLGVSLRDDAIRKVRAKKVSRMDIDKALSS